MTQIEASRVDLALLKSTPGIISQLYTERVNGINKIENITERYIELKSLWINMSEVITEAHKLRNKKTSAALIFFGAVGAGMALGLATPYIVVSIFNVLPAFSAIAGLTVASTGPAICAVIGGAIGATIGSASVLTSDYLLKKKHAVLDSKIDAIKRHCETIYRAYSAIEKGLTSDVLIKTPSAQVKRLLDITPSLRDAFVEGAQKLNNQPTEQLSPATALSASMKT